MEPQVIDSLRTALGTTGNAGPSTSPFFDSPVISNFNKPSYVADRISKYIQPYAAANNALVDRKTREEEAARAAQISALKAQKDQVESMKYQKVPKEDGGFDFFDPLGNPVTAWDYAKANGKTLKEVLGDSMSARDKQFLDDYENLSTLQNAIGAQDSNKIKEFLDKNPYLRGKVPADLMTALMSTYPDVFEKKSVTQLAISNGKELASSLWPGGAKPGETWNNMKQKNQNQLQGYQNFGGQYGNISSWLTNLGR